MLLSNIKTKQSNKIVLARWRENRIILQERAKKILDSYHQGQIVIVTVENLTQQKYHIFPSMGDLKKEDMQNTIVITSKPIRSSLNSRQLFIAQLYCKSKDILQHFHILCSLISTAVILIADFSYNLKFLSCLKSKVGKENSNKVKRNNKICNLVYIVPNPANEFGNFMKQCTDKSYQKLKDQGIFQDIFAVYAGYKAIQVNTGSLVYPEDDFQSQVISEMELMQNFNKVNQEVMYGPIITKYMEKICEQINQMGEVNIKRAENEINIDEGYIAYRAGIEKFHEAALSLLEKNSKPDYSELSKIMSVSKLRALDQFYRFRIVSSPQLQYRRMLEDYIDRKEKQITEKYALEQRNRNLQILQSESAAVLNTLKSQNQKEVVESISKLVKNYEQNARGPEKYELFNSYLKQIMPIIFDEDTSKQHMLKEEVKKNKELQKRIQQIRIKNSKGCCSSCSIM